MVVRNLALALALSACGAAPEKAPHARCGPVMTSCDYRCSYGCERDAGAVISCGERCDYECHNGFTCEQPDAGAAEWPS